MGNVSLDTFKPILSYIVDYSMVSTMTLAHDDKDLFESTTNHIHLASKATEARCPKDECSRACLRLKDTLLATCLFSWQRQWTFVTLKMHWSSQVLWKLSTSSLVAQFVPGDRAEGLHVSTILLLIVTFCAKEDSWLKEAPESSSTQEEYEIALMLVNKTLMYAGCFVCISLVVIHHSHATAKFWKY